MSPEIYKSLLFSLSQNMMIQFIIMKKKIVVAMSDCKKKKRTLNQSNHGMKTETWIGITGLIIHGIISVDSGIFFKFELLIYVKITVVVEVIR